MHPRVALFDAGGADQGRRYRHFDDVGQMATGRLRLWHSPATEDAYVVRLPLFALPLFALLGGTQ
jgi:hypothetical protein